jgi:serine O-acetyltransferase
MLEGDLYRGKRVSAFPLRFLGLLMFARGQRGCIAWLRLAQCFDRHGLGVLSGWASGVIERRYGCYINVRAQIGIGLKLPHPVGIVIGEGVVIGGRCTIYQHVTLGGRRLGDWQAAKYPLLGDDVVVFCGAAVLGAIHIGDAVTIGANSVVLTPIPAGSVAVGAPARVLDQVPPPVVRRA